MVVPGSTRNRVRDQKSLRGFESHPLRQTPALIQPSSVGIGIGIAIVIAIGFSHSDWRHRCLKADTDPDPDFLVYACTNLF